MRETYTKDEDDNNSNEILGRVGATYMILAQFLLSIFSLDLPLAPASGRGMYVHRRFSANYIPPFKNRHQVDGANETG